MSGDDELGLVFVPTGNATPDYYGAFRTPEMEKFSSSLVAIDIETGEPRWHFQTVHHDIWDYDVASQPTLVDLKTPSGVTPAVVQPTKQDELFVLDRRTGEPMFPVAERPVPQNPVDGEWLSPTQPHSAVQDFIGPMLTEKDMWGVTPLDQLWCRIKFRGSRYDGPFTPVTLRPTIVQPGYEGGSDWGSGTVDPKTNLLIMNVMLLVNWDRLMTREEANKLKLYPSRNPSHIDWGRVAQGGVPYAAEPRPFLSPAGTPCQRPPYNMLTATDLITGKRVWQHPIGSAREIGPFGIASHLPFRIGTPMFGGAITTASGLTFIAGTLDHAIRAFDTATGKLLWQYDLPGDGLATPMTYMAPNGRQFLIIGVGDPAQGQESSSTHAKSGGGILIAFALPPTH